MEPPNEDGVSSNPGFLRGYYVSMGLKAFWLSHSERCNHYMERLMKMKVIGSHNAIILPFYTAINLFRLHCKKNNMGKCKKQYRDAMGNLKVREPRVCCQKMLRARESSV